MVATNASGQVVVHLPNAIRLRSNADQSEQDRIENYALRGKQQVSVHSPIAARQLVAPVMCTAMTAEGLNPRHKTVVGAPAQPCSISGEITTISWLGLNAMTAMEEDSALVVARKNLIFSHWTILTIMAISIERKILKQLSSWLFGSSGITSLLAIECFA
jgi:hypothetical protein